MRKIYYLIFQSAISAICGFTVYLALKNNGNPVDFGVAVYCFCMFLVSLKDNG
jgi:hypothetical protein